MTTDEITDLLTGAYIDELETVMNYQTNAIVLDGIHAEEVKASLEEDIQEELGHAKMLGERLKQLTNPRPARSRSRPTSTACSRPKTPLTSSRSSRACSRPRSPPSRPTDR